MAYRILLADDEAHITMMVSRKLRMAGYEVETTDNGADAFERARQTRPDVIVTDFQMPKMSGDELARALYNDEATNTIPVIMLTARGFLLDDELQQESSIRRILAKPFSVTEVSRLVADVLAENKQQAGEAA